MENETLNHYRKSFYMGSILPDCKLSFFTKRHTYEVTFQLVERIVEDLLNEEKLAYGIKATYIKELGVLTHYVADYFTFPHNVSFQGNMKEHCSYEKKLMNQLKNYVEQETNLQAHTIKKEKFTKEQIISYLRRKHQEYLTYEGTIHNEIKYITTVSFYIVDFILEFADMSKDTRTHCYI